MYTHLPATNMYLLNYEKYVFVFLKIFYKYNCNYIYFKHKTNLINCCFIELGQYYYFVQVIDTYIIIYFIVNAFFYLFKH